MKKIILSIIIISSLSLIYGQKVETFKDSINYELSYMRYNLHNCHKEFKTGLIITVTSSALTSIFASIIPFVDNPKNLIIPVSLFSLATAAGSIVMIDSHKHIARASIKPTRYGLSFIIDFKP